jgi:drug/metabolite transporter (DMT)-like permease
MSRGRSDLAVSTAFVVLWSSGFVGADLGTRFTGPDTLLAWRYAIAAAVLWLVLLVRRKRIPRGAIGRQGLLGSLSQVLYLGGVVTGVGLGVPAGTAALVAALQPLVVATAAGPVLGEHTTLRQRIGLAGGLVGVGLVVAGDLGRRATRRGGPSCFPSAGCWRCPPGRSWNGGCGRPRARSWR